MLNIHSFISYLLFLIGSLFWFLFLARLSHHVAWSETLVLRPTNFSDESNTTNVNSSSDFFVAPPIAQVETKSSLLTFGTTFNYDMSEFFEINRCLGRVPLYARVIQRTLSRRVDYQKQGWREAMNHKRHGYKSIIENFNNADYYFFFDTDAIVISDPSEYLIGLCKSSDKVMHFSNDREKYSGGLVLICDTTSETVADYFNSQIDGETEQMHINHLNLTQVGHLDPVLFANAYLQNRNISLQDSFIFHLNYCHTIKCKYNRLRRYIIETRNYDLQRCLSTFAR